MKKGFMERTIEAHMLFPLDFCEARPLVSERLDARQLKERTSYFERLGLLIKDDHGNVEKSFAKWLALQNHDVAEVNSLHEWREAVNDARFEKLYEIDDLERLLVAVPALQAHIKVKLVRIEKEYRQLAQLCYDLDTAKERARKNLSRRKVA